MSYRAFIQFRGEEIDGTIIPGQFAAPIFVPDSEHEDVGGGSAFQPLFRHTPTRDACRHFGLVAAITRGEARSLYNDLEQVLGL